MIMVVNMVIVFVDMGGQILLIDVDLCQLWVVEYMVIEGGVGLSNVLVGDVKFVDVV